MCDRFLKVSRRSVINCERSLGAVHKLRHACRGLFSTRIYTPPPSSRSLFLEFRRVSQFFSCSLTFSVFWAIATMFFSVHDCVKLESFLRFTPRPSPLLVTRDAIYERPLGKPPSVLGGSGRFVIPKRAWGVSEVCIDEVMSCNCFERVDLQDRENERVDK